MGCNMEADNNIGIKAKIINNAFDQVFNQAILSMDLTSTQSFILGYLSKHRGAPICQKDIEKKFNMKHPTVTGLLQRLEEKGFIETAYDPADRRHKRITLTQKAIDIRSAMEKLGKQTESRFIAGFSEDEVENLCNLLDKVISNIRNTDLCSKKENKIC